MIFSAAKGVPPVLGRLRLSIAVGKGLVAVCIGHGELLAALFHFQLHLHRHPGALAAVKLPQGGQGLFGQLGIRFTAHTKHGTVDLAIQIAGGEPGTAECVLQQVAVVGTALAAGQAGADGCRHILRRAQTAFDLGRSHAQRLQLIQLVNGGIVLEGQVMQPARFALRQSVCLKRQAARPRAGAAVAAAAAQKRRHIALAAHAHAQRAMDEALRLDAAVLGDLFHLGQAQFAGQHHAGEAQLLEFQRTLQGVHAHLGGTMPGQLGGNFADQGGHGQVLADDGICPAGGHRPDGLLQMFQLGAVNGGVQRHMHSHAPCMAEAHRLLQAGGVKIAGPRAGIEARKAQIHRIRAAEHRRAEHLFTAHRGQDLDLCHNSPFI